MNYEKFKFSPISWDKVTTDHIGLCYSNDFLGKDIEVPVDRIEANKIGFPKDYPIATHAWIILKTDVDKTINRTHGLWFLKKSETFVLKAGVAYVFEETVSGVQISIAKEKYGNATNIEILSRVTPLTSEQIQKLEDEIIKGWIESVAYGWLNFPDQIWHVITGHDIVNYVKGSEICSGYDAHCINQAVAPAKDFLSDADTNPFEIQISNIWSRDLNVQPV